MVDSIYLQAQYHQRISQLLNNESIELFIREHYSESPNWKLNNDMENMIDTLIWISYSDKEKLEILDEELDEILLDNKFD